MVKYGLGNRIALIIGANNWQGIRVSTALAFVSEREKVVLVYKKVLRPLDKKADRSVIDPYYEAKAKNADIAKSKLKKINANYIILESDISYEDSVKEIYSTVIERYDRIDVHINNAAVDD